MVLVVGKNVRVYPAICCGTDTRESTNSIRSGEGVYEKVPMLSVVTRHEKGRTGKGEVVGKPACGGGDG